MYVLGVNNTRLVHQFSCFFRCAQACTFFRIKLTVYYTGKISKKHAIHGVCHAGLACRSFADSVRDILLPCVNQRHGMLIVGVPDDGEEVAFLFVVF